MATPFEGMSLRLYYNIKLLSRQSFFAPAGLTCQTGQADSELCEFFPDPAVLTVENIFHYFYLLLDRLNFSAIM